MKDKTYEKLFSPFNIGKVTIENRFSMAPMGQPDPYGLKGEYTNEGIGYFEERANGGFGLIFTGALMPDLETDGFNPDATVNPLYSPIKFMSSANEMTERCHFYGAKVFAELSPGGGKNMQGSKTPSAVPQTFAPENTTTALTVEEIKNKVNYIAKAAKVCQQGGFDGVEVHSFHWGYLLDEFANPLVNKRDDEYGCQNYENATRFAKEILEAIKETCGQDFPVAIRLNVKTFLDDIDKGSLKGENEKGRDIKDSVEIAKLLESYGYDALLIDIGVYESFYYACPPMYMEKGKILNYARDIKKALKGIPLIVSGSRLDQEYLLDEAMELADGVSFGRASLADPFIVKKYREKRPQDIRPCIGCNTCIQTILNGGKLHCAVNPAVTREELVRLRPTVDKKKALVVGGGLAGMEAARVLKIQGHDVEIYEKSNRLGGHLNGAGGHEFKIDVKHLKEWYIRKMEELDIPAHMESQLGAEGIKEKNPDICILALGSHPNKITFPGSDSKNVLDAEYSIEHLDEIEDTVLILGGGQIGCEIAIDLARQGKKVTIVEAMDDILSSGANVALMNDMALRDILNDEGVEIITGSSIEKYEDGLATIKKKDGMAEISCGTVILSVGMRKNDSFKEDIVKDGIDVYEIGDMREVGDVHTTIRNAFEVTRRI